MSRDRRTTSVREVARRMRRALASRSVRVGVVAAAALGAIAAPAAADFGIARFDGVVLNQDGTATTQAGGHPYQLETYIGFRTRTDISGTEAPDEHVRDISVGLPAGLVGNPSALPRCTEEQLETSPSDRCPAGSQVGYIYLDTTLLPGGLSVGVFNMEPPPGVPAAFGFNVFGGAVVHLNARVRPEANNALAVDIPNISQVAPLKATRLVLWGVPGDPSHDPYRGGGFICYYGEPTDPGAFCSYGGQSSGAPPEPFLTLPTDCSTGPVTTTLRARPWQDENDWHEASFVSHDENGRPIGPEGCGRVPFDPSLSAKAQDATAGAPAGLDVKIRIPQQSSPTGIDQSALKTAVVTLPDGMTVSPSSAQGLQGCTPEQIGVGNANSPACPEASKIGNVRIDTPLLREPLQGNVYLAQPTPSRLLRIYLVAQGSGVTLKLPGDIDPDPVTGRVKATFENNPQLPFSELTVSFNTGPRSPVSNSPKCGAATTSATFTGYNGAVVETSDSYQVTADGHGAPCPPASFAPGLSTGMDSPAAGADSTFMLKVSRNDLESDIQTLDVRLPAGLLGRISQLNLCADGPANAGACDAGSQIGTVGIAAGAGTQPFRLGGKVYMTGPYKGAPFGMSIVVPAVAGPFDLGLVVVRAAVHVDRRTAALRVISDPMPYILQGIPLKIREIDLRIDRPGFMFNPTNCARADIGVGVGGLGGASASLSRRFQVANCTKLPFKPRMSLKVGARGRTRSGVTTPLQVALTMTRGQANNRVVQVTLPRTLNTRVEVVSNRNACTPQQFAAERCPQSIGTATAVTPLLRDPLKGSVYLVRTTERKLPDMVVALKGQVAVDLVGKIVITRDLRVRTTFDTVPDVPITKFSLNLVSGRNGAVGIVNNLCSAVGKRESVSRLGFQGQNGKRVYRNQKMQIVGCGRASRGRRASRR